MLRYRVQVKFSMYEIRTRHNNISQSKEIKGRGESSMIVTIAVFVLYNSGNCRKKKGGASQVKYDSSYNFPWFHSGNCHIKKKTERVFFIFFSTMKPIPEGYPLRRGG